MVHTQEPDFVFPQSGRVHLNRCGASVQSTAGSRGVLISLSNFGYTTFGGGVRVLATHSIRQFPLHFPSRASPCATTFRTSSTFLILFLKVFSLQGKDASKPAGNWFQFLMVLFTKEFLPKSALCFLFLIFQCSNFITSPVRLPEILRRVPGI